jgi:hypothetical protein
VLGCLTAVIGLTSTSAQVTSVRLNPASVIYTPSDQIKWTTNAAGAQISVVQGDLEKPGLYIYFVKWLPHMMSTPHFHPNDRYITVVSGTWWVGTGTDFDREKTVPMRPGSYVTHFGRQIHYDGAKDEECILEIVGMGPGTAFPAAELK